MRSPGFLGGSPNSPFNAIVVVSPGGSIPPSRTKNSRPEKHKVMGTGRPEKHKVIGTGSQNLLMAHWVTVSGGSFISTP